MEGRPLVASAASGSISSALLWLLSEFLRGPSDPIVALPSVDLDFCHYWNILKVDFWGRLFIGFFLWPLLEVLVLVKQWVTLSLRNRIFGISLSIGKLYKVI